MKIQFSFLTVGSDSFFHAALTKAEPGAQRPGRESKINLKRLAFSAACTYCRMKHLSIPRDPVALLPVLLFCRNIASAVSVNMML